ncbi:unnamed protein product [Lactuca virosa]|uniref:Histone deacetylase domain-containing protein n=1 Tax=Lactuca virosa TaxID=75947 RepID=A0AAU9LLA3_9ASTR|nr:unnamed protein product [Lactuca virosa]
MGFCLFNNIAIATSFLLNQKELGINMILIVDWDVHHGNGTQKTFYKDSQVLFFSVHRDEYGTFYPCGDDGSYDMKGEGYYRKKLNTLIVADPVYLQWSIQFSLLFFEPLSIAFETLQEILVHGFQLVDIWVHHSARNTTNSKISKLLDMLGAGKTPIFIILLC